MTTPKKNIEKTRRFFRTNEPLKTQQEIAKENKAVKDAKKEVKTLVKNNKETFEEMTKTNTENSVRLENQIEKMGKEIVDSNKEVK